MAVDSPVSEPLEDVRQPLCSLTKLSALHKRDSGERMGYAHPCQPPMRNPSHLLFTPCSIGSTPNVRRFVHLSPERPRRRLL